MLPPAFVMPALAFCGLILIGGIGGAIAVGPTLKRQRVMKRRMAGMARYRGRAAAGAAAREKRIAKAESPTSGLDAFFARLLPQRSMLQLRLERTGRPITVTHYVAAALGLALVVGVAVGVVLHLGPLPGLLSATMVGVGLPHIVIGRMGKKRINKFMMVLPEAVDLMVRALRSGLPITEAIINAGQEVADPVGVEFRRVESALRLGRELDDVLWDMARRLEVPEFRFFVICLSVQRETGGNLAETLANLGDMLRRRRQMKLKIKALSSEARASATVLGLMPFAVAAMMTITSPEYVDKLFTDPRGLLLCGFGVLLMIVGVGVMAKIINFEI
jgi:tight adherence protein B